MKAPKHQLRLAAGLRRQISHLESCLAMIPGVNAEVYSEGKEVFRSDSALVLWLSEPNAALRGKVPMALLQTPQGRKIVAQTLRGIAHGVVL